MGLSGLPREVKSAEGHAKRGTLTEEWSIALGFSQRSLQLWSAEE